MPIYHWHLLGNLHVSPLTGTFLTLQKIKCSLTKMLCSAVVTVLPLLLWKGMSFSPFDLRMQQYLNTSEQRLIIPINKEMLIISLGKRWEGPLLFTFGVSQNQSFSMREVTECHCSARLKGIHTPKFSKSSYSHFLPNLLCVDNSYPHQE